MSKRESSYTNKRGSSRAIDEDKYYKGSRHDSRDQYKHDRRDGRDRSRSPDRPSRRSRSRSRSRSREDKYRSRYRQTRPDEPDTVVREMSISPQRDEQGNSRADNDTPSPPPAPRITKISIGFNKPIPKPQPIKLSLGSSKQSSSAPIVKPKVASVFDDGSDEEPEEMPAEARMRMRNIGRETPTSAGPNSFGKTKHGFCDPKGIIQRNLKDAMDQANPAGNSTLKYPSTIYKL